MNDDPVKEQLKRAIRVLVRAEIVNSWKGISPPEDHPIIEDELKSAKTRVSVLIARLELKDKP